jgi:hypothetical protein
MRTPLVYAERMGHLGEVSSTPLPHLPAPADSMIFNGSVRPCTNLHERCLGAVDISVRQTIRERERSTDHSNSLHVAESHGQQALPGERHLSLPITHIALLVLGFEFSPERLIGQASTGRPDKKAEIKKDKGQTRSSKGAYAGERSIMEDVK